MRRRLKPSHLSGQEFPVAAVHVHLDPASLPDENSLAVDVFRLQSGILIGEPEQFSDTPLEMRGISPLFLSQRLLRLA
jgi:hypothetical protein